MQYQVVDVKTAQQGDLSVLYNKIPCRLRFYYSAEAQSYTANNRTYL